MYHDVSNGYGWSVYRWGLVDKAVGTGHLPDVIRSGIMLRLMTNDKLQQCVSYLSTKRYYLQLECLIRSIV